MKRLTQTLLLLCVLLTVNGLSAQSKFSNPGRVSISTGVGIFSSYMKDKSVSSSLPVHLMLGYRASKKFNISAFAGYSSATSDSRTFIDGFSTYLENNTLALGLRSEVRHELTQRMEVYGGLMLGYYSTKIKEFATGTNQIFERKPDAPTPYNPDRPKGSPMYSAYIGSSYFFKKGFGLYGELGYGVSLFNFGVVFRM